MTQYKDFLTLADWLQNDLKLECTHSRGMAYRCAMQLRGGARLMEEKAFLLAALQRAVSLYGQEGGPWNVPGDPGGWITQAQEAIKFATETPYTPETHHDE